MWKLYINITLSKRVHIKMFATKVFSTIRSCLNWGVTNPFTTNIKKIGSYTTPKSIPFWKVEYKFPELFEDKNGWLYLRQSFKIYSFFPIHLNRWSDSPCALKTRLCPQTSCFESKIQIVIVESYNIVPSDQQHLKMC